MLTDVCGACSLRSLPLVLAQEQQCSVANTLLPLIPWLVIFFFIWFFVFRLLKRQSKRTAPYLERSNQHMDAVEAKLDRLIELMERQNSGK